MSEREADVRVLIVDDQYAFRAVASMVVGMVPGWSVVAEAETGEQAVALAADRALDVIIMDINLPGISGIEATELISAQSPAIRIVLASTYAPEDLPAEAADCGAVGYIRKEDLTAQTLREAALGGNGSPLAARGYQ